MFEDEGVPFLDSRDQGAFARLTKRAKKLAGDKLPLSRSAALGLCAVAVCAGLGIAVTCLGSADGLVVNTGETAGQSDVLDAGNSNAETAGAGQEGADEKATDALFVHVVGAVKKPGMYELPANARLADAVAAAGGMSSKASAESVNLARALSDGEQVRIPTKQEAAEERAQQECDAAGAVGSSDAAGSAGSAGATGAGNSAGAASTAGSAGTAGATGAANTAGSASATDTASSSSSAGKININTATASELQTLNGIGEVTAQKIIDDRAANGTFAKIEDITRVSGIGDKKFAAIRDSITVG